MPRAGLFRRPTELPRQRKHILNQRAAADFVLAHLRVLAVLRAEHAQPLAVRPIARIVKVAEHRLLPVDSRRENAPERRLRLVLVEALLHVPDRGSAVDLVAARDAVHRLSFFVVGGFFGGAFRVDRRGLGAVDDRVEFPVAGVELVEGAARLELLAADLVEGLSVFFLGDARAERPFLDALRQDLVDTGRRQALPARVGAIFRAPSEIENRVIFFF